ncbi:unnamed protein product [Rotaria sp. Silwood2]|nr:unnamed protein product [Rotaria sp. Silwood2]CAF2749845.1 unnamed protein product [Rotaria sp. Silwood2]CAF3003829.1 unnamed protein product [Rotaria sp. Silwood2]CAF3176155.1 unnamed protein product [Rotaria sp. Silwood2]CAF3927758.1 unnamed protein product [Rotaria sp. Silwood2]
MQSITILSCLIIAVTILSVRMHPHGGDPDRRPPPFGNGTFHFNGTFPPRMNDTDDEHHGFRPHHGNRTEGNVTFVPDGFSSHPPHEHEGNGDHRPGRPGGHQ